MSCIISQAKHQINNIQSSQQRIVTFSRTNMALLTMSALMILRNSELLNNKSIVKASIDDRCSYQEIYFSILKWFLFIQCTLSTIDKIRLKNLQCCKYVCEVNSFRFVNSNLNKSLNCSKN